MSEKMSMVDYYKKFQEQVKNIPTSNNDQNTVATNQPNNQTSLDDYSGFSIGQGFDNQGRGLSKDVLESPQNIQSINIVPSRPTNQLNLDNVCPQCGTIHPPLSPGQKCPIAQEKQRLSETGLSEEKVSKFVQDLKNIVIANLSKIKNKPAEKILQEVTIEVTKFLEKQQD